jgi:hypothetical protein
MPLPAILGRNGLPRYAAALAMVALATLVVADLNGSLLIPKFSCFAAAVCWSFVRLGLGPGICALCSATLATDYWVIEPLYSISLNGWDALALVGYSSAALLISRFGVSKNLEETSGNEESN